MEFSSTREHDERHLSIAKDSELLSFLKDPISSFGVRDLPVGVVLNTLDLNLSTTHFDLLRFSSFSSSWTESDERLVVVVVVGGFSRAS